MATTRKATARNSAAKRPVARIPAAKKPAAKRSAARKPAARPDVLSRASGGILRLAGVGTDAVARATGKAWDQWLAILDKAGAARMPHKAIAALLAERFGVPGWWSRMVTVGYEQARGFRKPHQQADGFAASASRTVAVGVDRLYGAWSDPALRALWLGAAPVEVKRATDGRSMRIAWKAGGSSVDVTFQPAGKGRSKVRVHHGKLPDEKSRAAQKGFWAAALDRLEAMLEKAA